MTRTRLCTLAWAGLVAAGGGAQADYVGGLDPNGDNNLALRSQPNAISAELGRLAPNTVLEVLQSAGQWRLVRTQDGRQGWAHRNWIYPGLPGQPDATRPIQPAQPQTADSGSGLSGLAGIVPGSAASAPAAHDWLPGHMETYHDPLKYYP